MCGGSDIKCEIKVSELKDGYQVQITGDKVKDTFIKAEDIKKCIQACCSGEKSTCCR